MWEACPQANSSSHGDQTPGCPLYFHQRCFHDAVIIIVVTKISSCQVYAISFFWFSHRPSLLRSHSDRNHAMLPAQSLRPQRLSQASQAHIISVECKFTFSQQSQGPLESKISCISEHSSCSVLCADLQAVPLNDLKRLCGRISNPVFNSSRTCRQKSVNLK